ncbi:tetraacyldisaccharide 4'-kinase [soil metagenome]
MKLNNSKLLSEVLRPFSYCYGLGAYARLVAYSAGLASRRSAVVPVVSVGNITVGGTGKTPLTIDLAERLSSTGLKVAILSRGYGRKSKGLLVVADGSGTPLISVEEAGDEPFLIAQAVPEAVVIVCSSRLQSAQLAVRQFAAQVIILDDGFQHIKLKRDIDIVLWDFNDKPEQAMLLPSGRLREPLSGLSRASDIVITKVPENVDQGLLDRLQGQLADLAPRAAISSCRFGPAYLSGYARNGKLAQPIKLSELAGKKVYSLCGIARPEGFLNLLADLGVVPIRVKQFDDHHWFSPSQINGLEVDFRASGADLLVTTEKDLVRMTLSDDMAAKTWAVVLETQWISAPPSFLTSPVLSP